MDILITVKRNFRIDLGEEEAEVLKRILEYYLSRGEGLIRTNSVYPSEFATTLRNKLKEG